MDRQFIDIGAHRLEYQYLQSANAAAPTLVFLHEGLGSVALWKAFPLKLAEACGCNALIYSRHGHGWSSKLTEQRKPDYMHREALDTLPALLQKLSIQHPILFGHSDGASIAIMYAASASPKPMAAILCAPHVMVEDITIRSIAAAKVVYESTDLPARLGKYHEHCDLTFRGWNDIWLNPEFRNWNIEAFLPHIHCPVLAIQGHDDEYGTMEQLDHIERQVPQVELLKLHNCKHSPHIDQAAAVMEAVVGFVRSV